MIELKGDEGTSCSKEQGKDRTHHDGSSQCVWFGHPKEIFSGPSCFHYANMALLVFHSYVLINLQWSFMKFLMYMLKPNDKHRRIHTGGIHPHSFKIFKSVLLFS